MNNYFKMDTTKTLNCEENKINFQENLKVTRKPWYIREITCEMKWLSDKKKCDSLNIKINKKVCIFLHGAGEQWDNHNHTEEFTSYWGKVHELVPQCSKTYFIRQNTKSNGWDVRSLQKAYCDLALIGERDKIIRNKIIFAHSMGSLVLAGGIKNQYCVIFFN
jgi:hypothetical protein